MKLLVEPCDELPLAQLVVTFRAGGVHDPAGLEGLSRLTARMLRRGTRTTPGQDLEERVDGLGAELGAHVGLGSTTVGVEAVVRSAAEAADILAEVIAEPAFDEDELDKLKRQAEAEIIASRDDDDGLAARALRRQLFRGHPHARRVQGTIESIRAVTRDDVVAHHRRAYTKQNAILAVGGAVEREDAMSLAQRVLARLPDGETFDYGAPEPVMSPGRRLVIVDKPDRSQCQLGLATMGVHPSDEDYVAMVLANTVFGGTFTSRLNQEIRVKRGWSYGASSGLATGHVRDSFTIWSAPSVDDAVACLELELQLLEEFVSKGIDDVELEFARQYVRRSYAFEIDTAKKRLQQRLDRALLGLPEDFDARLLERLDEVSVTEVGAALARRIDPSALWVSAVAGQGALEAAFRRSTHWDEVVVVPHDQD